MKIFHTICSSPLPSGIGKSPDRKTGNNDHHTAPEQIGEDVSKCAVKHAQRNTDQDGTQGLPARKSPFFCRRKRVLQHGKENDTCYPAEL